MKLREKEYRALYADALSKGAMKPEEVDALVKAAQDDGRCYGPDEEDDDEGSEEIDKAADMAKAARADLDAELAKASTYDNDMASRLQAYEVQDTPGEFPDPQARTATRRTGTSDMDIDKLPAGEVLRDICKGAVKSEMSLWGPAMLQDILQGVADIGAPQRQRTEALFKGLVAHMKAQDERIDALTSLVKAGASKQKARFEKLQKALTGGNGGSAPVYDMTGKVPNLTIVPEPGEKPNQGSGNSGGSRLEKSTLIDWAMAQMDELQKSGGGVQARARFEKLADAVGELHDAFPEELEAIAHRIGFKAA